MKYAGHYLVAILIAVLGSLILYHTFVLHAKWEASMPDDGTMLCSGAGEGFVVVNNPFGFRVDRHQAFNQECKERMK